MPDQPGRSPSRDPEDEPRFASAEDIASVDGGGMPGRTPTPEYLCNCGQTFPSRLARAARGATCAGRTPTSTEGTDVSRLRHPDGAVAYQNCMNPDCLAEEGDRHQGDCTPEDPGVCVADEFGPCSCGGCVL